MNFQRATVSDFIRKAIEAFHEALQREPKCSLQCPLVVKLAGVGQSTDLRHLTSHAGTVKGINMCSELQGSMAC